MSTDESDRAWELSGKRYSASQDRAAVKPMQEEAPWSKGVAEDLASDASLIARDETRMIFSEKQSAEVWRARMNREAFGSADNWDVRQVRVVRKDAELAEAMREAGITPVQCGDYYILDADFFERGLALELLMALRKRIRSLEGPR